MAAYAALVNLSKAIDQILPYEQHYVFLCEKQQMQSLHDKVISFQVFLQDISSKSRSSDDIDELETRIRDLAYRLEDIVEPILMHSLALEYENQVSSRLPLAPTGRVMSRKSMDQQGLVSNCISCCRSSAAMNEKLQSLHNKVLRLQEFLQDASRKLSSSTTIQVLEGQIRYVSFGLEDIVKSILVLSLAQKSETEASLDDILGWCLDHDFENKANYSHLPSTTRAAAAFGKYIEEVDVLLAEAMEMRKKILDNKVISRNISHSHNIATTSSTSSGGPPGGATDTNVGLDDALNQILDWITGGHSALEVIPVTGMGGIGKTTLARAVYDRPGMQHHFDLVLWATISQDYVIQDILRHLDPQNVGSDAIVSVHKKLKGRRYLIILDDVWDIKVWDEVRNAFPDDRKGSRIILTTRLSKVATYVSSSSSTHVHRMQFLNEEQSWDLLRETVYGHEADYPSDQFEYIGKRISRNCKGLPLALVVIGGLLKFNKTRDYWEEVARSTKAKASANDECLLGILSLSYTNLPPHLKACFMYFGMFPKDKEIPTKELVRLWCAEGFLKQRESKTMEEVAEECLEELIDRSLVLVKKKRYNGKIKTSSIHDVLRDLSLRKAQKEKFFQHSADGETDKVTRIMKDQRRVSFSNPYISHPTFNSCVRTYRDKYWTQPSSSVILNFKLLRVLPCSVRCDRRNSSLGNLLSLTNLRYLHLHFELHDDEPVMVPGLISKLRNLETIVVSREGGNFKYRLILPSQIWEMPRLRHLIVSVGTCIMPPFKASSDMNESILESALQTLSGVASTFDFTTSLIKKIGNLKKLKIDNRELFSELDGDNYNHHQFSLDNLNDLHHLEDLHFHSGVAQRLTSFCFPQTLKKLCLCSTEIPWERMVAISKLPHLQVLKLYWDSFVGDTWEPTEGGFRQLKYLKMEDLHLKEWRVEPKHFPSLEQLFILNCGVLEEIPGEIGEIETLEKLSVTSYYTNRSSLEESVRRIQEEHEMGGNDSLQAIFF